MLRKAASSLVLAAAAFIWGACVTDYGGRPGESTQGEAKLWGSEVAILGFSPFYDGTWSPTVNYGFAGGGTSVTINSYLNPVFASFSRDGLVDRDGDDIQGRSGAAGGKFNNGIRWIDNTPGAPCEFFGNLNKDFTKGPGPAFALCIFGAAEEVDKDLAIQDAFESVGGLLQQIWAGGVASAFTIGLTSVTLNGTPVTLTNALSMDVTHNGFRPTSLAIDFSSPGGQELLQSLLTNTVHGEATSIGFGFDGGMSFSMPVIMVAAFNHDALRAALE